MKKPSKIALTVLVVVLAALEVFLIIKLLKKSDTAL